MSLHWIGFRRVWLYVFYFLPSALLPIPKKCVPRPSLLQGEQPCLLQPLLPQGLQLLHGIWGPLLHSHQYGHASLILESHKLESNGDLSTAEPRRGITFCNLIATIFLMQPKTLSVGNIWRILPNTHLRFRSLAENFA